MSDPVYMDFEEPHPWDDAPKQSDKKKRRPRPADPVRLRKDSEVAIPVLPAKRHDVDDRVTHGVSNRDKSCVNLRLAGASFVEIADLLEYKDAQAAKKAFERALAMTHPAEDWEALRATEVARAEMMFRQSLQMAQADYLVDRSTGEKTPNVDKLRWHQQAAADLMAHATISGAKAPTKVELTPGEVEMERLVSQILERGGYEEVIEAEVLELEVLPTPREPEEGLKDGPEA